MTQQTNPSKKGGGGDYDMAWSSKIKSTTKLSFSLPYLIHLTLGCYCQPNGSAE